MPRPDTWMPFYWRDFWADTGGLSPDEGWAYLNLIGAYWMNGGPLPNDDVRLQRLSRCSPAIWNDVRATVVSFFDVNDDRLNHRRVDVELKKATETYERRKSRIDRVNIARRSSRPSSPASQQSSSRPEDINRVHNTQYTLNTPVVPKGTDTEHECFADFWKAYPSRGTAANPRKRAAKAFGAALRRGADPDALVRLASTAAPPDKHGTEFVPQAATWLNEDRWKDVTPPPAALPERTSGHDLWKIRMEGWHKSSKPPRERFWAQGWGPRPGEPGCEVPKDLLDDGLDVPAFLKRDPEPKRDADLLARVFGNGPAAQATIRTAESDFVAPDPELAKQWAAVVKEGEQ